MQTEYFQSKSLTRDYHSLCNNRLKILDVMVSRRTWRRYCELALDGDTLAQIDTMIKRFLFLRGCSENSLILVADKKQLPELFQRAYKGVRGKINPWLRNSGAAAFMALVIDRDSRHEDRPISYAFPAMSAQDTILFLMEQGLGSSWLAGVNGDELTIALGLSSDKWVPAIIVFGKTEIGPSGFNIDNLMYKSLSRKRKILQKIISWDYYGKTFNIPDNLSDRLKIVSLLNVQTCLDSFSGLDEDIPVREINQIEWELMGEAARIAPSSGNRQLWRFIFINNKSLLAEIADILNEKQTFCGIIAGLGVCGTFIEKGFEIPFWMIDLPIAFSHITIMAGALNFTGKVYLDIPEKRINSLLKVESNWRTVGLIGLR